MAAASVGFEQRKAESAVHFTRGQELERAGRGEEAFREYLKGVQILLDLSRSLQGARKAECRKIAEAYLSRAETIKRAQSAAAKPPAPLPANVAPEYARAIEREILEGRPNSTFDDIVGMRDVKEALYKMAIMPILRPDLLTGLRAPPRGLLLYGPPGNGKTMVARAVAAHANATFFNISPPALTSKNYGDAEKLVRALFAVAPSIIFIDEIDAICPRRSGEQHEASTRVVAEFLTQMNAVLDDKRPVQVLVIGATNLPENVDDAVVRRLSERIFVGHPDRATRLAMLAHHLRSERHSLTQRDIAHLADVTEGYSASDLRALCKEAALEPLSAVPREQFVRMRKEDVPPITAAHFTAALRKVRPSVSPERLAAYGRWALQQGGAAAAAAAAAPVAGAAVAAPAARRRRARGAESAMTDEEVGIGAGAGAGVGAGAGASASAARRKVAIERAQSDGAADVAEAEANAEVEAEDEAETLAVEAARRRASILDGGAGGPAARTRSRDGGGNGGCTSS